MRLASIENNTRDGKLIVVSRDNLRGVAATGIAENLLDAMDRWDVVEAALKSLADSLEDGTAPNTFAISEVALLAPLPRSWQWLDGSAYDSHGELLQKVFKSDPAPTDRPLMYQGVSDTFYTATQDIPFPSEDDGIDFEGEFGVIVDRVPMGTTAEEAAKHIRLLVQINDWSLRAIVPIELKTGFGWVQGKPPCSVAPFAVTPDELGANWRDGRIDLPLVVDWNEQRFGAANGYAMSWSFPQLVAHAARTRNLVAGTMIGSGTVSNSNFREVGSSCIAERRGIELDDFGEMRTQFMRFGDRVRMEARTADDQALFGAIEQKVVKA